MINVHIKLVIANIAFCGNLRFFAVIYRDVDAFPGFEEFAVTTANITIREIMGFGITSLTNRFSFIINATVLFLDQLAGIHLFVDNFVIKRFTDVRRRLGVLPAIIDISQSTFPT